MRARIIRYAVILVLILSITLIIAQPPRVLPVLAPNQAGRLERMGGVYLVYLDGDAYEMGLQQGTLLRTELRDLVEDYLYGRLVLERGAWHFLLLAQARLIEREVPGDLRREIQGIADGAGLSYHDVLLLNTIPDLQALTHRLSSWGPFPALFAGAKQGTTTPRSTLCTTFAGWGGAILDGELIVGHSLDCAESDLLSRYLLLAVRRPSPGNAFVSLGLMGTVGSWAGMNEESIAATLSSSPSVDVDSAGQVLPFLLRQVLQSSGDLTEAANVILSAHRICGGNVLLGDGKAPAAVAIELSAHRHAMFEANAEGGLLARTNHFLDSELALAQQELLPAPERAASEARLEHLQALLEVNRGWIGMDKALAFLSDAGGTMQSVLFDPGKLTMWMAQDDGTAPNASYVRLDFASALLGRR